MLFSNPNRKFILIAKIDDKGQFYGKDIEGVSQNSISKAISFLRFSMKPN